jgi:site-specific DNA-methyltransferase (adenine-specific)
MKLYKGDCLIESDKIESGSVDLILTDLPYGTVKGLGGDIEKYKRLSNSDWDNIIDTNKIMQIANRILRKNGKMVLTANQPFTTELISKAIPNLPHCYNMYWDKMHFANCLVSKKAPVSYIEDVLIFSKNNKKYDRKNDNPLRYYFADILNKYGKDLLIKLFINEGRYSTEQSAKANVSLKFGQNKTNFEFITNSLYEYLKRNGIKFYKTYEELKEIHNNYHTELKRELNEKYPSTFNLWEGKKYKSNILKYKKDYDGYHPTQKPILLLEDLIKTFSNENDLVVDLTMGSGSTGVACKNTNRNFIGIEQDENYFNIAQQRIKETEYKLF